MNSLLPTQLGFTQRSQDGSQQSQLIMGQNVTGSWEAVGLGAQGRPDPLEIMQFNFALVNGQTTTLPLRFYISASDLTSIMQNPNAPSSFNLRVKEVSVCETDDASGASTEKRMVILGSNTYLPAS